MIADAPLFDTVAEGPEGGRAYWLTTADGLRVRMACWTREDPVGTILLFPGRTEYVEKYGRDARDLMERGFNTVTIDWRGQGLADRMNENRLLGHVHSFGDYQHDVNAMLEQVYRLGLPGPYFLLAHSMGGCIGLRSLHENLPVAAAAFSAPMWGIRIPGGLRQIAWGLSTLVRPFGLGTLLTPGQHEETYVLRAEFDENSLTSDRDMFEYMRRQVIAHPELALGGPSLHWLNEALVEMLSLRRKPAPLVPTVTFLGSKEAIVEPARVRQVMAGWDNGTLIEIDGARHEILMERPEVRTRALDTLAAHFRHAIGATSPVEYA